MPLTRDALRLARATGAAIASTRTRISTRAASHRIAVFTRLAHLSIRRLTQAPHWRMARAVRIGSNHGSRLSAGIRSAPRRHAHGCLDRNLHTPDFSRSYVSRKRQLCPSNLPAIAYYHVTALSVFSNGTQQMFSSYIDEFDRHDPTLGRQISMPAALFLSAGHSTRKRRCPAPRNRHGKRCFAHRSLGDRPRRVPRHAAARQALATALTSSADVRRRPCVH